MSGFLDAFAMERAALLASVERLQRSWSAFAAAQDVDGEVVDGLLAVDLAAVRNALANRRFSIGLFGLVKRGKSTLLNALVGSEVSSVHVAPETAVPVYVDGGDVDRAEVRFVSGRTEEMSVAEAVRYTSQTSNADNHQGVLFVRQLVASAVVRNGVRLIDTPGLDDADADDTYTTRTLQELDAVDAGLVVFQSPPTVGLTEMRMLREIVARDLDGVILVCNMYPEHYHDPVARAAVLDYITDNLADHVPDRSFTLLPVCAIDAWRARVEGDATRWEASGIGELLHAVEDQLVARVRRELFAVATQHLERAAAAIGEQVRRHQVLLDDPEALHDHRIQAERAAHAVERELRGAVGVRVAEAARHGVTARSELERELVSQRAVLAGTTDARELQRRLRSIRRGVEIASTDASNKVRAAAEAAVYAIQEDLARAVGDVLMSVPGGAPKLDLHASAEELTIRGRSADLDRAVVRSLGSALAGGAVGGLGLVVVGAALGPIGLVAGALAGWRLGGARSGADRLRESLLERFDVLADDVLRAYDQAVGATLDAIRAAALRRVRGYVHDLLRPLDDVEAVADDEAARHTDLARCASVLGEVEVVLAGSNEVREAVYVA